MTVATIDGFVQVEVQPDTETLCTSVSRDVWDTYYKVPEHLVTAVEQAQAALDSAVQALTDYIEANNLQPLYVEED